MSYWKDGKEYKSRPVDYYDSTDSSADKTFLSDTDKALVQAAKDRWATAHAAGDQAGMDAAHADAEAIREKYGYQGGANGGAYNELATPGSGSGGSGSGSSGSDGSRGGSGGGSRRFSYASAPDYVNRYQGQIDALTKQILGRAAFEYDPKTDPTYQQYKESYTRSGQRAMQDTLGQVSARTGGLASSYAGSAAQQTYDGYMSALADKIPELRQLAYQMYQDEGAQQRANLEMLMALEQGDYAKYQTLLSQYNADRGFDYGVFSDDRAMDYQVGRDAVADSQWQQSFDRGVLESDRDYAADRADVQYTKDADRAALLAAAGNYSGYADLWGLTEEETAGLVEEYARQRKLTEDQAARDLADWYAQYGDFSKLKGLDVDTTYLTKKQNAELYKLAQSMTGGSSSGGGGSAGKSAGKSSGAGSGASGADKWTQVEEWVSLYGEDAAEDYIKENYKALGYSAQSAALSGWKNHRRETGSGLGDAGFSALARGIVGALDSGSEDSAAARLEGMWEKLSWGEKDKMRQLLARYGLEYEEG